MTEDLKARLQAAQQSGNGIFTETEMESFSTEDLRLLVLAENQAEQQQKKIDEETAIINADQLDRRFADKPTEEIKQELVRKESQQRLQDAINDSPEAKAEALAASAERRAQDAQFVAEQIEKSNSQQLDALVAKKVLEQKSLEQKSEQVQRDFVSSHEN